MDQKQIGESLKIYCQNHNNEPSLICSKDDFRTFALSGGCSQACRACMPCGHVCEMTCHVIDPNHKDQFGRCDKLCGETISGCGHKCPKTCYYRYDKECGSCIVTIEKLRPECQHIVNTQCSKSPSIVYCTSPCEKTRKCGHKCKSHCGAICTQTPCNEQVKQKAACGHTITTTCTESANFLNLLDACTESY